MFLVSGKKYVAADLAKIFEDRFLFEEGVSSAAATSFACGSDEKMGLAYTTGQFSVPHSPARASRTTGGVILYGAVRDVT